MGHTSASPFGRYSLVKVVGSPPLSATHVSDVLLPAGPPAGFWRSQLGLPPVNTAGDRCAVFGVLRSGGCVAEDDTGVACGLKDTEAADQSLLPVTYTLCAPPKRTFAATCALHGSACAHATVCDVLEASVRGDGATTQPRRARVADVALTCYALPVPVLSITPQPEQGGGIAAVIERALSHRRPVVVPATQQAHTSAPGLDAPTLDTPHVTLSTRGVDATGCVRTWQCEVLMAKALLQLHTSSGGAYFQGLSVVELGAGSAGVAGVALASAAPGVHVLVTDGNPDAATVLRTNVRFAHARSALASGSSLCSDVLVWDAPAACARAGPNAAVRVVVPMQSASSDVPLTVSMPAGAHFAP
ncbi:hypothetical protein EON66_11965, partial [archaeon]